jgi:hypothetical protein
MIEKVIGGKYGAGFGDQNQNQRGQPRAQQKNRLDV